MTGPEAVAVDTTVHLSVPPVLPKVGGHFDADLDITGPNGSLQLPSSIAWSPAEQITD